MELATLIEITITEFWNITPFELSIAANSYRKRRETANKELTYQAYLISRWVWQKKIDIEKVLNTEKQMQPMTDNQMLERVKALNALFGGEVKIVGKE